MGDIVDAIADGVAEQREAEDEAGANGASITPDAVMAEAFDGDSLEDEAVRVGLAAALAGFDKQRDASLAAVKRETKSLATEDPRTSAAVRAPDIDAAKERRKA